MMMYPDIDWAKEPDLDELRIAQALLATEFRRAESMLEDLANKGSIAGLWYLGDTYASGRYVAKNLEKARTFYLRAETSGWLPASYRLGRIYFTSGDYKSAFESFSKGAAKGYIPAVYRLGMMYKDGLGTQKAISTSVTLLGVAASKGHLFAKRDLAGLYLSGAVGIWNIPRGIAIFTSLIGDLVRITISGEWRNPAIEEKILA
jgi:hypothetical protein